MTINDSPATVAANTRSTLASRTASKPKSLGCGVPKCLVTIQRVVVAHEEVFEDGLLARVELIS